MPRLQIIIIVLSIVLFLGALSRLKKCPSDKIMVVYNLRNKASRDIECIHGGAKFIWPVIQQYRFLDTSPITINIELENALNKQNLLVNLSSIFTVAISVEPETMKVAAQHLLGLETADIAILAKDIISAQLRLVIATTDIEEMKTDGDKFLTNAANNMESELKKIGLCIVNMNICDLS